MMWLMYVDVLDIPPPKKSVLLILGQIPRPYVIYVAAICSCKSVAGVTAYVKIGSAEI